ncbi:AraC family transcriptional regulator [Corallococcus sp. AS-1-12]|uniref:AraC family transcriptional regulator n=1 Tax=Corallococcus sp. AS-1-12 TaxID=2874598 RepID=UPI001CBAC813|nr:AraC family transcriptional regulator [Corallococcus sp. AS-1-12]MBZ4333423.1 AraC family transcriptional regulator [Corallococcus sp. AS-1-12]
MSRPRASLTVTSLLLAPHVEVARRHDVPLDDLYSAHHVEPAHLQDPEVRVPLALVYDIWREMGRGRGEPHLGLRLAAEYDSRRFDVIGYVVASARTVGEALDAILRYQRLLFSFQPLSLVIDGDEARFVTQPPPAGPGTSMPGDLEDFTLGGILTILRRLLRRDVVPRSVRLRHPAPADTRPYRRFFNTEPEFGAEVNEFAFDAGLLSSPVPGADPSLHRVVARHADDLLARAPSSLHFVDEVRRQVLQSLRLGMPTAADVARGLSLSSRSLARRLADEGTSLSSLIDEVRRELALTWLRQADRKTLDIAFMLGFSEVSAFHRAFRRWTGTTPAEFRRAHAAG